VFVPNVEHVSALHPDLAAYAGFPLERRWRLEWHEVSPVLVVEVLGGEDEEKDLVRNPDLYDRVPTIQEYWVFDIREDSDRPKLRVFRRQPQKWEVLDFDADATYRTPLLPGFELPVTPSE
jgi:Uma2 family endonuclease